MPGRLAPLRLYRQMLRATQGLRDNNIRAYAWNNVRDRFRERKDVTDEEQLRRYMYDAEHNLGVIKRQGILQNLYDDHTPFINDWKS